MLVFFLRNLSSYLSKKAILKHLSYCLCLAPTQYCFHINIKYPISEIIFANFRFQNLRKESSLKISEIEQEFFQKILKEFCLDFCYKNVWEFTIKITSCERYFLRKFHRLFLKYFRGKFRTKISVWVVDFIVRKSSKGFVQKILFRTSICRWI